MATEQAPILIQPTLLDLIQEIDDLEQRLKRVDHALAAYADANSDVQALLGIQGIGVTIATAFVARVPSIHMFKRGRSFSSWLGLTCREYSSGQTRRRSRITKQGDRYLRTMLVHGARAALKADSNSRTHKFDLAIGPGGADPLMARWCDHHLQRPDTRMQPISSDRFSHVAARRKRMI